jgi:hypothetical protein
MTQNYHLQDALNFPSPSRGEEEAVRICNAALSGLQAITMRNMALEIVRLTVVKALRQFGLLCQNSLDGFGYVHVR